VVVGGSEAQKALGKGKRICCWCGKLTPGQRDKRGKTKNGKKEEVLRL
jgi:hypothetical protein